MRQQTHRAYLGRIVLDNQGHALPALVIRVDNALDLAGPGIGRQVNIDEVFGGLARRCIGNRECRLNFELGLQLFVKHGVDTLEHHEQLRRSNALWC